MAKIVGKYKMETSEGFDEFMKALGEYLSCGDVPYLQRNTELNTGKVRQGCSC